MRLQKSTFEQDGAVGKFEPDSIHIQSMFLLIRCIPSHSGSSVSRKGERAESSPVLRSALGHVGTGVTDREMGSGESARRVGGISPSWSWKKGLVSPDDRAGYWLVLDVRCQGPGRITPLPPSGRLDGAHEGEIVRQLLHTTAAQGLVPILTAEIQAKERLTLLRANLRDRWGSAVVDTAVRTASLRSVNDWIPKIPRRLPCRLQ